MSYTSLYQQSIPSELDYHTEYNVLDSTISSCDVTVASSDSLFNFERYNYSQRYLEKYLRRVHGELGTKRKGFFNKLKKKLKNLIKNNLKTSTYEKHP